jgi:hypothetical protein
MKNNLSKTNKFWSHEPFFKVLTVFILILVVFEFLPIKVLTNWTIEATPANIQQGGLVTLNSSYDKNYDAAATSHRFLECKSGPGGVTDYPLVNNYPQYPAGHNHTTTQIALPSNIPSLPQQCRIFVHTQYILYGIKPISQVNWSNYFTVTE